MEEHVNYGLRHEQVDDCMMYKQIGEKKWTDNSKLDMLGYWY